MDEKQQYREIDSFTPFAGDHYNPIKKKVVLSRDWK